MPSFTATPSSPYARRVSQKSERIFELRSTSGLKYIFGERSNSWLNPSPFPEVTVHRAAQKHIKEVAMDCLLPEGTWIQPANSTLSK